MELAAGLAFLAYSLVRFICASKLNSTKRPPHLQLLDLGWAAAIENLVNLVAFLFEVVDPVAEHGLTAHPRYRSHVQSSHEASLHGREIWLK